MSSCILFQNEFLNKLLYENIMLSLNFFSFSFFCDTDCPGEQ
jgi:hypothetical protein